MFVCVSLVKAIGVARLCIWDDFDGKMRSRHYLESLGGVMPEKAELLLPGTECCSLNCAKAPESCPEWNPGGKLGRVTDVQ